MNPPSVFRFRFAPMACAIAACAGTLTAEEPPPAPDFRKMIEHVHARLDGKIRGGYACEFLHGGRVAAHAEWGYAIAPGTPGHPPRKWTVFEPMQLASASKTITAAAVMKLRDEKGFSLDDPFWQHVRRIIPRVTPDAKKITIRHLLTHSGGISDKLPDANTPAALEKVLLTPLAHPPGVESHYANNNFYALRLVIEQISGEPYTAYVQRHLLKPMGAGPMTTRSAPGEAAYGYDKPGTKTHGNPYGLDCTPWAGAAGWYASAQALGKFLLGLRNHTVISEASVKEMQEGCFGLDRGLPDCAKGGDWGWSDDEGSGSWHSAIVLFHDDVQAVLLINAESGNGPTDILFDAWKAGHPKPRLPPGAK